MDNLPDPLTIAFPNLLKSIPENERLITPIIFGTTPGSELLTEFIILPNPATGSPVNDETAQHEPEISIEIIEGVALDEDVMDESGADAVTEIIELDEAYSKPAITSKERKPPYRGRRRAQTNTLPWVLLIGGAAALVYGVGVQLYLAPTHPLMAGISIPALVMAGAALMAAISEKR